MPSNEEPRRLIHRQVNIPNYKFSRVESLRSLGRVRRRYGKHRGISRKKEYVSRLDEVPNGLNEAIQVAMIRPHTITCRCDHARVTFDEVCGSDASRVDSQVQPQLHATP